MTDRTMLNGLTEAETCASASVAGLTTATKAGGAVLPVVAHEYTDRRDGYRYVSNACASETLPEAIALTPHAPAQATIDKLRAEVERLTRERDETVDVLHRGGFVRCDIAACNCGSWHARFGWPERFREFTEALEEHGANLHAGKTALAILKEQLSELDALKAKQIDVDAVMRLAEEYAEQSFLRAQGEKHTEDAAREALRAELTKDRT